MDMLWDIGALAISAPVSDVSPIMPTAAIPTAGTAQAVALSRWAPGAASSPAAVSFSRAMPRLLGRGTARRAASTRTVPVASQASAPTGNMGAIRYLRLSASDVVVLI